MWRLSHMVMHKVALGTFTTQPSIFILQLLVYCPWTNMFSSWLGELSGYASRPALAVEAAFCYWVQLSLNVCRPSFFKIFYLTRVNWPMIKHLNTRADQIQERAPLFLVSKKNLNPSYWHIWCTKNCQKWNKNEKVAIPQSRGGQRFKKTNH